MHLSKLLITVLVVGAGVAESPATSTAQRAEVATAAVAARPEAVTSTQPIRLLDTRIGLGARTGALVPGVPIRLALTSAVPAGSSSVMLNVTATEGVGDGWVKSWPCDEGVPPTSSLNFTPGRTAANAVILRATAGAVCFMSSVPVQLIADLNGSFSGADDFVSSPPNRIVDTRVSGDPLRPGVERRYAVAGTPGIDGGATIAALNLTIERPALAGWVVAYPCGQPSNGSTVNFGAGETVANLTLVGLTAGQVCVKALVDVQLIVDTFGWSRGLGQLKVQSPSRLLDTRDPGNWPYGPEQSGDTIQLRVAGRSNVPNSAAAALITVTVADPAGEGFVTVWPCDQPFPTASTINTFPGALRSNLALVQLSAVEGEVCLRYVAANATPTSLIVDAVGWVTGTANRAPPSGTGRVGCGLAGAVFCETFDAPAGDGGKTGDLNSVLWGVSRIGDNNPSQQVYNDVSHVSMTGCGTTAPVPPPGDVRICNGKMFEALNDGGTVVSLNTYPKQPFDFAGRTGKVAFDVSADSQGSHGAWPEFVITDKPVPGMRSGVSGGTPPGAQNEVGITFDGCSTTGSTTGVGLVYVMRNGEYSELPVNGVGCVTKGSLTSLNHFEIRISQNRLEVWGTDPGSASLRQLAIVDNLGLTFTKGLVWLNDVHYNARKAIEPCECGTQWNHTFAWDNLAFDGPKTYRDLGFNVPDANVPSNPSSFNDARTRIGYQVGTVGQTFTVTGVNWSQQPTGALVVLNAYSFAVTSLSVSINGGAFTTVNNVTEAYGTRAPAIPVPLDQVRAGTNTITIKSGDSTTVVSNITLIIVAGAPVP